MSKTDYIIKQLKEGVLNIFTSDNYLKHLQVMSKFYNYSYRNQILILKQNPHATFVKGYKSWQNDFGRIVKKGEKGIKILAPYIVKTKEKSEDKFNKEIKNENNGIEEQIRFKIIYVFDI